MKKTLVFLSFLSMHLMGAQSLSKVENYELKAADLVLFAFGMEEPVPIGKISDSGEIQFNFPSDLNAISDEAKANFLSDTAITLFAECDNRFEILPADKNPKAASAGYVSLSTKKNPYAGLLFMVTDNELIPWLEDAYSNSAIESSYFELIYIESDFNYQGECTTTSYISEDESMETKKVYNLELKAGYNFIEYAIESVSEHKVPSAYYENEFDIIKKPSKITISSSQSTPPNTKWIGKFF